MKKPVQISPGLLSDDETSHTDMEETLRLYDSVLSNSPDFIYIFNKDHRLTYANRVLLETWGMSWNEAKGKTLLELGYEPWHAEMHNREIDLALLTGKPVRGNVPFTGTNGRRIYDYIFSPLFNADGNVVGVSGYTRDITEHKETEESLKKNEETIRFAFEASHLFGVWDLDLVNDRFTCDMHVAKLFSLSMEEAERGVGLSYILKAIHPEDVERVKSHVEEAIHSGDDYVDEHRLVQSDKSVRWISAHGKVRFDENDRPIRFLGLVVDITDEKEARIALQASEERFSLALASSQIVGAWDWDIANDVVKSDESFAKLFSINPKDAVEGVSSASYREAIHPEDRALVEERTKEAIEGKSDFAVSYRIIQKDGGIVYVRASGKVHFDESGKPVRFPGIIIDVTKEHYSMEALHQSEQRFRAKIDTMAQMIWVTRPDGYHEYYNKRWYEFTGMPEGSTDGEGWTGMFHEEDQPIAQKKWHRSLETGEPYEVEYRLRRHDGVFCWVLGRALPIRDKDGNIMKWVGSCTLIEEQKQLQHDLEEARKNAEEASIAKTEFLANMSHEIRTPMNAVIGIANILASMPSPSDQHREFVHTMQVSANALLALINDLLDISKIEDRSFELEEMSFNFDDVLQDVISILSVKASEKGLDFTCLKRCDDLPERFFNGDPTRIRQILMNLCSNAIKFTEKGFVSVEIDCLSSDDPDKEIIFLRIRDTGVGIAPDKMDVIFQKFMQADTSINRKYGGTGLGLAITKTLIESMGGRIEVQSTPDVGSTFTVYLSLRRIDGQSIKPKSVEQKNKPQPDNASRKKILLVEDYAPNVMVAEIFLDQFGYDSEVASNGIEAMEKFKSGRFDLILMDVQMHGMNGLDATILIRDHETLNSSPNIPIIGMTAHAIAGDRERCLKAGMNDYISKPYNPEDLQQKLKQFLG